MEKKTKNPQKNGFSTLQASKINAFTMSVQFMDKTDILHADTDESAGSQQGQSAGTVLSDSFPARSRIFEASPDIQRRYDIRRSDQDRFSADQDPAAFRCPAAKEPASF